MASKTTAGVLKGYTDFLSSAQEENPRRIFKTGLIGLNQNISKYHGIPGGSLIQLVGDEKSGKSTLSLDILAQAQYQALPEIEIVLDKQKLSINAVYVDFERSFDREYAEALGVDVSKVLLVKTPWGEQSFDIVEHLLAEGIQLIIIDSIPMFVPKSEGDKSLEDNEKMAANASILGRAIKRLIQLADSADALVIVINQNRSNISQMSHKEKKPFGARILQYAVKLTISLTRIKNEDDWAKVRAVIEKNKFGKEGRGTEFSLLYGEGIDYADHILTLAQDYDILEKSGSWYYYPTKETAQYRANGLTQAKSILPLEEIKQKVEEILQRMK